MSPRPCHILLVRHARTDWNVTGRRQSHRDVPLDDVGLAMARALAEHGPFHGVSAIYTSDLARAAQSAAPIAERLGLTPRPDMRLRESRAEPAPCETYPVLPFPLEQESAEHVTARMVQCLDEIVRRHAGERVAVVSHGGAIRRFLGAVIGGYQAPPSVTNTAICHLEHHAGQWSAPRLFDCDHLQRAGLASAGHDAG